MAIKTRSVDEIIDELREAIEQEREMFQATVLERVESAFGLNGSTRPRAAKSRKGTKLTGKALAAARARMAHARAARGAK